MKRRQWNEETNRRDKDPSDVDCPAQQKTYCETYHWIDKENGVEAKYDLSTESHLNGWGPKIAARYFNIDINNSYKVYTFLYNKHHNPDNVMPSKQCIQNSTHSVLQQGYLMRQRRVGAPPSAVKDITTYVCSDGKQVRSDSQWQPFSPMIGHGHLLWESWLRPSLLIGHYYCQRWRRSSNRWTQNRVQHSIVEYDFVFNNWIMFNNWSLNPISCSTNFRTIA